MKRQQCEEATEEIEPAALREVSLSPQPELQQKISKQLSHSSLSSLPSLPPKDEPCLSLDSSVSVPARQPSLDPLCGLESLPLLYSSSPSLLRPALPIVRIIPDSQQEFQEPPASHPSSASFPSHHYQTQSAGHFDSQHSQHSQHSPHSPHSPHSGYGEKKQSGSPQPAQSAVSRYSLSRQQSPAPDQGFGRQNLSHHRVYDQGRSEAAPKHVGQFGHCPKVSEITSRKQNRKILQFRHFVRRATDRHCLVISVGTPLMEVEGF